MKYCSACGHDVSHRIPEGDNRLRFVCENCSTIHYQNPRVIAGCLVTYGDEVLLCRRAIEPRSGYWTLPAGFLENGETVEAGAARETWEEANARVDIVGLYTVFSLPHISQIYLFYRGELVDGSYAPGVESQQVELFNKASIPWDNLAFPVVQQTLEHYFDDRARNEYPVHTSDIIFSRDKPPQKS